MKMNTKGKSKNLESLSLKDENDLYGYNSKDQALGTIKKDDFDITKQSQLDSPAYSINENSKKHSKKQAKINNIVIVQNQLEAKETINLIPSFKSTSIKMVCPFCQAQIRTFVETHLNCMNLCCYCWTSCLVWACFQLIRGKDLSCSDARHSCPKCGRTLGYYEAC